MQTSTKTYKMDGMATYNYALQGMKPHHLANRWNFANVHTKTYSAVLMEFTTPQSYGKTKVGIGGIVKDGELVCVGEGIVEHVTSKQETPQDWPEPRTILWQWNGQADGKPAHAEVKGDLPIKTDRIEVLAHLPGFVKSFIGHATGLKPHIFQVREVVQARICVFILTALLVHLGRPTAAEDQGRRSGRGLGDWQGVY